MIRIVLADDEELIRGALAALLGLEPDLEVVAQAADGVTALALAREHRPDVLVLDLEMPRIDGVETATVVRDELGIPVVLVTRHARPGVLRRALVAGVRGFVPKSTPSRQLADIVRAVHAGRRYVDAEIAASALTASACPLTERELEVLRESHAGGAVAEIASRVHLAPGTVRNYLSSAIAKLGVSTRQEASQRAWDEGWI